MGLMFFATAMTICIAIFCVCFFIFFIKNKIRFHDPRGPILFGNMLFFESSILSNISAITFILSYLAGLGVEWERYHDSEAIKGFSAGGAGFILLLLHCRYFSKRDAMKDGGYAFLKEFFLAWRISASSIFLWLSRASYCYFIYKVTLA